MTQDVQQWLAEIQLLQQRLIHVSQERVAAYEQLSRWQRSYQTEAQQRRKDIRRLQTVIYHLNQENKRLKQQLGLPLDARFPLFTSNALMSDPSDAEHGATPSHSSESSQKSSPINQKLQEAIAECDLLSKALSQEQSDHEQTRQTLMTALGDTVEQLERERKRHAPQKPATTLPLSGQQQKQLAPAPPSSPNADPA